MRHSLPACAAFASAVVVAAASAVVPAAAQPAGQYRAFWVDTFNTSLADHGDVLAVVDKARAAHANAIFAQEAPEINGAHEYAAFAMSQRRWPGPARSQSSVSAKRPSRYSAFQGDQSL